jgi:hypothetical protein
MFGALLLLGQLLALHPECACGCEHDATGAMIVERDGYDCCSAAEQADGPEIAPSGCTCDGPVLQPPAVLSHGNGEYVPAFIAPVELPVGFQSKVQHASAAPLGTWLRTTGPPGSLPALFVLQHAFLI